MPRTVPVRRPTPELARSASASWATGALDEVRREVWRTARQAGATTPVRHRSRTIRLSSGDARDLKHARYALWKNGVPRSFRTVHPIGWTSGKVK